MDVIPRKVKGWNLFEKVLSSILPLANSRVEALLTRTFHAPNLIHWIKYMKSSASESVRNACFNLERLSRSFRLARPGISPLDRLWNAFDSDAELFMYRTQCINYYNVFCKQFDRNEHFSPFELSSAAIKIGVWINSAGLNDLCQPSFELASSHEKKVRRLNRA